MVLFKYSINLFLILLILISKLFAGKESTEFPYGGKISNAFYKSRLNNGEYRLYFTNSVCFSEFDFKDAMFFKTAFDSLANFSIARFSETADFFNSIFKGNADFSEAEFSKNALFNRTNFIGDADFEDAIAHSKINFNGTIFNKYLSLRNANFDEQPDFRDSRIKGILDISGAQFLSGVDFRVANLDSLSKIIIDDKTVFPEGKFWIKWNKIKNRVNLFNSNLRIDSVRLKSDPYYNNKIQHILYYSYADSNLFPKIEIFYHRLYDNYKAQNDNESADGVMYELGKQRALYLHEWYWEIYGLFFGWGYQPWRFLLFVVLPLIIGFSFIWYWFYYELVIKIIDDKIEEKYASRDDKLIFESKRINLFKGISLRIYNHSKFKLELNRLLRYWHVLFFSASVLLSIRIKKEWVQVIPRSNILGQSSFLKMLSFEWILGVSLYIIFAIFVKGSRFEFIKGLLGF